MHEESLQFSLDVMQKNHASACFLYLGGLIVLFELVEELSTVKKSENDEYGPEIFDQEDCGPGNLGA